MSPDANAHDRIYTALKSRLAAGHYPPGLRLEILRIADEYRSSATPVREVLARLVGEGLVEAHVQGGFRAAHLDASALAGLYQWSAIILGGAFNLIAATNAAPLIRPAASTSGAITAESGAATIASLFSKIAQASQNDEIIKAVILVSTRLSFVRIAEPTVLKMVPKEIYGLQRIASSNDMLTLRRRIVAYHQRRIIHSDALISVLPQWID